MKVECTIFDFIQTTNENNKLKHKRVQAYFQKREQKMKHRTDELIENKCLRASKNLSQYFIQIFKFKINYAKTIHRVCAA